MFVDPFRVFVLVVTLAAGCARAPAAPSIATFTEGSAQLALVRAQVPEHARKGARVEVTLAWEVRGECAGTTPSVFVHIEAPGAELRQAQADHVLSPEKRSATEWKVGETLTDTFAFTVPSSVAVDTLDVYVGIYEAKDRWHASAGEKDRVKIATVHVDGAPPLLPVAHAKKVAPGEQIVLDGVLDEPVWNRTDVIGPFVAYDGKSLIQRSTAARLAWDDAALYVAFTAADPDPFTPYTQRDDPLYESEALEIFIDADGDKDVYVELQSAPNDLHFDAAFSGGRRKNMDRAWDAPFETKSTYAPSTMTLTQEWRIPVASLKDIPAGEPRAGATWRINLFRLERVRDTAMIKVLRNEASAWCTPLSGDFHNLDRFCPLTFDP